MRIILNCADCTISDKNKQYSEEIGWDTYHFEIDSVSILPIGTIIDVTNKESRKSMQLKVTKHWYDLENNILYLNVDIDGGEMSSNEFIQYLKQYWTTKP